MTIEELFAELATRMIGGMMFHEQLMNAYMFLGLSGYAKCHEYHYISETDGYIRLTRFALEHYGILVQPKQVQDPGVIPETWYNYSRDKVDHETRTRGIQAALTSWIRWEEETKNLYSTAYTDFIRLLEIHTAEFVKECAVDVEEELVYAKNELLAKTSMDFDIVSILEEQKDYEKLFSKKIRKSRKV